MKLVVLDLDSYIELLNTFQQFNFYDIEYAAIQILSTETFYPATTILKIIYN